MGKGGPLAFLNKKTWHPANARNQEEVWKREQAYLAELKKGDELRKQIEEEREKEEWERIAENAKRSKKSERLEWMYQGGFAAQEEATKRKEELLLGKHAELPPAQDVRSGVDAVAAPADANLETVLDNPNESWARLNADPLLWMKREEQAKVKSIVSNPYQMMQMKEQIRRAKQDKKASKKEKHKDHKKRKSKPKNTDRSDSQSASPPASKRARINEDPVRYSPRKAERSSEDAHSARHRKSSESAGQDVERRSDHRHNSQDGHDRNGHKQRDAGKHKELRDRHLRETNMDRDTTDNRRNHCDEDRHEEREKPRLHREDSRRHSTNKYDGNGLSGKSRSERDGRSAEHRQSGSKPCRADDSIDQGSDGRARATADRNGSSNGQSDKLNGYGLREDHIPEYARAERQSHAEDTRARLSEAAKAKAIADEAARKQRYVRKEYTTGKMSEEEKAQRRAEMMSNAGELDEHRTKRLVESYKHGQENGNDHLHAGKTEKFVNQVQRDVLFSNGLASMQEQVRRKKGTLQK